MKSNLQWIDDRWHLANSGIHAGECLEIRWPDGTWEAVRIESGNRGQRLFAYASHCGQEFAVEVTPETGSACHLQLRLPAKA